MTLPHPTQNQKADAKALDLIWREARSFNAWEDKPVDDALLQQVYDLAKMAPTAANSQPLRVTFVKSQEAKARLKPLLDDGNIEKSMTAPVVAILACDLEFYNELPWLFPHVDAKSWFSGDKAKAKIVARQNGNLQGGYFMLAARALGLDCGPMGGFDHQGVDTEFFKDHPSWRSLFICALGYGSTKNLFPRSPRGSFDTFCKIL